MSNFEADKERHSREQQEIWTNLRDLFILYKEKYGASITEIADGLDISRQFLHKFMKEPAEYGLSKVDRSDLLNLWSLITDPRQYATNKLNDKHKSAREELRRDGADELLETAKYQTLKEIEDDRIFVPDSLRIILERLSSNWIQDDILRNYIINSFLDQILDLGRTDTEYYIRNIDLKNKSQRAEIENFPEDMNLSVDNKDFNQIVNKYKRQIHSLAQAGKTSYVKSELFELYQSILEHHVINKSEERKIVLSDCQFETISPILSISDQFKEILEETELPQGKYFRDYEIEAESKISFYAEGKENNRRNTDRYYFENPFPRITRARVTCLFYRKTESSYDFLDEVSFENESTTTHIENMFLAVKKGLGHQLSIAGFFLRATGRTSKSLARISVGLEEDNDENNDPKTVYQGWWVSPNTITGILNAVGDAFSRYLSKNSINRERYSDICINIAKIKSKIRNVTSYLYEGSSKFNEDKDTEIKNACLGLLSEIEKTEIKFKDELYQRYLKPHLATLICLKQTVELIAVHSSFIRGNLNDFKEIREKVNSWAEPSLKVSINEANKSKEDKNLNPYNFLISIHQFSCLIRYRFMTGDKQFLYGKPWESELEENLYNIKTHEKILQRYTQVTGSINFEAYFCASQIFGIIGQLGLYSLEPDRIELESSIKNFILATHYSYRIGHLRRASQWLMNAVRVYCRLGTENDIRNAVKLMSLSHELNKLFDSEQSKSMGQISGIKSQDWLTANQNLAQGEIDLTLGKYDSALRSFSEALNITYTVEYVRLMPDCLYNMHRALEKLIDTTYNGRNPLRGIIKKTSSNTTEIYKKVEDLLFKSTGIFADENFQDIKADWRIFSEKCRDTAALIWHEWASAEGYSSHPFEEAICEGSQFLGTLQNK